MSTKRQRYLKKLRTRERRKFRKLEVRLRGHHAQAIRTFMPLRFHPMPVRPFIENDNWLRDQIIRMSYVPVQWNPPSLMILISARD